MSTDRRLIGWKSVAHGSLKSTLFSWIPSVISLAQALTPPRVQALHFILLKLPINTQERQS